MRPLLALTFTYLLALSACSTRQGDFTVLTNRNVDFENVMEARRTQNMPLAEYTDRTHWILFIPVSGYATIEEAVDGCLDQANGDCLVDAAVYQYGWTCILYSQTGWKVRGRPLSTYSVQSAHP